MTKPKRPARIDAHQHVWKIARGDYGWLTAKLAPIFRDFSLDDLRPFLVEAGIDGTVMVQAAPTLAETQFMLERAKASKGLVRGVVGWVDMAKPDAPQQIAKLAKDKLLVGIRPMIHDIPDPDWMLDPVLEPAYLAIMEHDLAFDALVRPAHLTRLLRLSDLFPQLRIVVDHGAKPAIARGAFAPWARDVAAVAERSGVLCKLSGLATEAAPHWKLDHLKPYVDFLLERFGPNRLIWGSDWPVVDMGGGYLRWWEATERLLERLNEEQRARVLGLNAVEFYGLG
jgi:L-fuconolactonase